MYMHMQASTDTSRGAGAEKKYIRPSCARETILSSSVGLRAKARVAHARKNRKGSVWAKEDKEDRERVYGKGRLWWKSL